MSLMLAAEPELEIGADLWGLSEDEARVLEEHGQHFTAGLMLGQEASIPMRFAHGIRSHLEKSNLWPYHGEMLYPSGGTIWADPVNPPLMYMQYVDIMYSINIPLVDECIENSASEVERRAFEKVKLLFDTFPKSGGWTHSIIEFGRVLSEGLESYRNRINMQLSSTEDVDKQELYRALLIVVDAIDCYRMRIADYLNGLSFAEPELERNWQRLAEAYRSGLPMRPADGFLEAMVSTIFMYAIDGSDDLGRFDQYMWPYLRHDLDKGIVTREEAVRLVRTLWHYVDDCCGWNTALGGSTRSGAEASNELTLVCLEAGRKMRRPNLALRLRKDTPENVWDAAIDTIASGNGLPALYCEENYLRAIDMAQLNLPDQDKRDYAFGGCTELMVHGCSNVGSLDGDFSVIEWLEKCLQDYLPECSTFEEFLDRYESDMRNGIAQLTAEVSRNQENRSLYQPQLIRTLLIDDCIDRGKNYHDGGARYNWSILNIVGLSNAIDSLSAVRKAIYEDKKVDAPTLLAALRTNFEGHDELRRYLQQCPRFGNDDPEVNALAERLSGVVYREFKRYAPWRGGKFLAGTLMFVTYGMYGQRVGATPDGRLAETPVADSAGPVQGRDHKGPTAMLHSTASLQQLHAPGTLVVNIRVAKELVSTPGGRERLKSLIRTYFDLGGMQIQVNVVDQEVLKDAMVHPEDHKDLIIRMGGYSEYFNNLTPDLKASILERTEHAR
jgi:trans-4-hydroxy-L-proline dehydratase